MIITVANPKGGTGKTTLVRALSGTAADAGNDVFLIDADRRANTMRWGGRIEANVSLAGTAGCD